METILKVPYRSQKDSVAAGKWINDCGPACLSMLLAAIDVEATPTELYDRTGVTKDRGLAPAVLTRVAKEYGLELVPVPFRIVRAYPTRYNPPG